MLQLTSSEATLANPENLCRAFLGGVEDRLVAINNLNLGVSLKKIVAWLLSPLILFLRYMNQSTSSDNSVVSKVRSIAIDDSANFVSKNLDGCLLFDDRERLWEMALESVKIQGIFLELGVWKGESISFMASKKPSAEFFGFDSFQGLAESWSGTSKGKGFFDVKGNLPKVPGNVSLIDGWFESTLPNFVRNRPDSFAFVHFDADTYESTKFALETFSPRLVAGTVLVFDEFHGYPNWRNGEYRAWNEFVDSSELKFRYIAFSTEQVAILILSSPAVR